MNTLANRSRTARLPISLLIPLILLPLLGGVALRLWFIAHAPRVAGDALIYGEFASNWLQHGVYGFSRTVHGVLAAPKPTLIRLPGYPLFLAICFRLFGIDRYGPVVMVQMAIDLLSSVLLADLARRLFGARAGILALWLAALCPFTATYAAAPIAETLSLACIVVAFYGLQRWQSVGAGRNRWLAGIAAALAYALLLRPEQGMLAATVVPAMAWIEWRQRRSFVAAARPALIVSLITLLPLVPWTLRNERTFHVFQPLAPRFATDPGDPIPYGFQRWYRTWGVDFASTAQVYWNYDGAPIDIDDLPSRAFDSDAQYNRTEALLSEYNRTSNASPGFDARFDALATERIHAHPWRYWVGLRVARVLNMMLRPRTEMLETELQWWKIKSWPRDTLVAGSYAALNLGYLIVGYLGFTRWRRNGFGGDAALAWSMAATVVLRCVLLLTLDNSEPRYTLEFFPVLIVFAAAWLEPTARHPEMKPETT